MQDWKDFNGYKVYENGLIINKKNRPLKTGISNCGYEEALFFYGGKYHHHTIHRIVASLFIENTNNCKCVNHKDGNKLNNKAENLEWCSHSENMIHAVKNKLFVVKTGYGHHLSKPVKQIKDGVVIAVYGSQREAARVLGLHGSNISAACKGKIKKLGGYNWSY